MLKEESVRRAAEAATYLENRIYEESIEEIGAWRNVRVRKAKIKRMRRQKIGRHQSRIIERAAEPAVR